jgi:hypothetical protein
MKKRLQKLSLSKETLRNIDRSFLMEAAGFTGATNCGSACVCSATHVCSDCKPCA